MRKLDPQCEYLVDEGADTALSFEEEEMDRFGLDRIPGAGRRKPKVQANVFVQYTGDPDPDGEGTGADELREAGLVVRGVAGDVVTGAIDLDDLPTLAALERVERVEAARTMHVELDESLPEARADLVHAGPPGRRGAGVIVGVVDTGCDFTHPAFRNADGTSRILAIWDQNLSAQAGESAPAPFGYGVEYTQAQINAALNTANPFDDVRHGPGSHGTHVTGIAAGDGSVAGNARPGGPENPAGTYVGVAPEADIIVVSVGGSGPEGIGTSTRALDAVNFIFRRAATFDKACVVNMSLGDNLGPHDGTSLLERGLDNLLGARGRAFVKSAGNAGNARIHAQGNVSTGETEDVRFMQGGAGDTRANQIDLWYDGADTFRISIVDPTGEVRGPVPVGTASTLNFGSGNTVRVDHRNNDPFNGDKRVFMTFRRGGAGVITPGAWRVRILGVSSPSGGRFDAWAQRGRDVIPQFLPPHESRSRTISTPGTAREIITAANYSARGFSAGSLASSSSRGPTRDGRAAPTVAAPGTSVISAAVLGGGADPYTTMSGTSMAAPHITGAVALMFQKNRNRTQAQIKACIESSARTDGNTGPTPNTAWGHGKLDADAAVDCVPGVLPPSVVTRICRSVPIFTCVQRSVPQTTCAILSVPRTTCVIASVPRVRCGPSVAVPCLSVPIVTCGGGRSVVPTTCGGPSVIDRCPSVVDGCPSTPGGCEPFDPGTVTPADPTRTIDPTRLPRDPGTATPLDPGRFGAGGFGAQLRFGDAEAALYDHDTDPFEGIETPEEGYFEYDDGWFDVDES